MEQARQKGEHCCSSVIHDESAFQIRATPRHWPTLLIEGPPRPRERENRLHRMNAISTNGSALRPSEHCARRTGCSQSLSEQPLSLSDALSAELMCGPKKGRWTAGWSRLGKMLRRMKMYRPPLSQTIATGLTVLDGKRSWERPSALELHSSPLRRSHLV